MAGSFGSLQRVLCWEVVPRTTSPLSDTEKASFLSVTSLGLGFSQSSFSCSSSHWGSWDRFNKTPSAPAARKVCLGAAQDTLPVLGREGLVLLLGEAQDAAALQHPQGEDAGIFSLFNVRDRVPHLHHIGYGGDLELGHVGIDHVGIRPAQALDAVGG